MKTAFAGSHCENIQENHYNNCWQAKFSRNSNGHLQIWEKELIWFPKITKTEHLPLFTLGLFDLRKWDLAVKVLTQFLLRNLVLHGIMRVIA